MSYQISATWTKHLDHTNIWKDVPITESETVPYGLKVVIPDRINDKQQYNLLSSPMLYPEFSL